MEDNIEWLPWLYKVDASDVYKRWRCGTEGNVYYAEFGSLWLKNGEEGKLRRTKAKKIKGNMRERDAELQAKNYAQQQWEERKRKDEYYEHPTAPMCTVEEWKEMHGKRKWPAVCLPWKQASNTERACTEKTPWLSQYKIDGDRATAWYENEKVELYARSCLEMRFKDHLRIQLESLFYLINYVRTGDEGHYKSYPFGIDGEIWNPKLGSHQQSHSISGRTVNRHKDEEEQCFAWFDIIDYNLDAVKRMELMEKVRNVLAEMVEGTNELKEIEGANQKSLCVGGILSHIFIVPYKNVESEEALIEHYDHSVAMGFEGLVLRRHRHMYPTAREHKIATMIKMKPFEDAEFEVVGFKQAEGDREGCVVWLCQNDKNDETFSTQQMGDVTWQRALYKVADQFVGRKITVRFDDRSDDLIPKKPRAIRFRMPEDIALDEAEE
jgi:ATP-dependent DNA ligase